MDKTSHAIDCKLSSEVHSLRVDATSVTSAIKGFGHKVKADVIGAAKKFEYEEVGQFQPTAAELKQINDRPKVGLPANSLEDGRRMDKLVGLLVNAPYGDEDAYEHRLSDKLLADSLKQTNIGVPDKQVIAAYNSATFGYASDQSDFDNFDSKQHTLDSALPAMRRALPTEFDATQFITNNVIGLGDGEGRITKSELVKDIATTSDPAAKSYLNWTLTRFDHISGADNALPWCRKNFNYITAGDMNSLLVGDYIATPPYFSKAGWNLRGHSEDLADAIRFRTYLNIERQLNHVDLSEKENLNTY
jgi:hypothetical protein